MTLEEAENRRRQLASAVKRLRVAAMSDPERGDELADALVQLTAASLLAGDLAEAAALAPEAAVLAARLLASRGPTGPYASLPDAVRHVAATTLLAAVQAGLGHADAAGRTLDGLDAWRPQVARLPLADHVPDDIVVWNLVARARAALAGDVALANAAADAAELRLHGFDAPPYLALAVHLLVADARWAAGRPESALAHHRLALDAHHAATADPAATRRPAVAKVALAPVPAVYEAYADRLAATGDHSGAVALRRAELAVLKPLPADDTAARAGLATALARAGRHVEAADISSEIGVPPPLPAPGEHVDWEPLASSVPLAPVDPARSGDAAERWRRAEQSASFAATAARAEAERDEAVRLARAQDAARQRAEADADAARQRAEAEAAAAAAREEELRREAERAARRAEQEQEALRAAAEERRRTLAREHERSVDPEVARAAAAELAEARDAVRTADGDAAMAAAADRLASVLRPLAAVDDDYRPELAATLDSLVGLLWRLGDADGSRAAAREARSLA